MDSIIPIVKFVLAHYEGSPKKSTLDKKDLDVANSIIDILLDYGTGELEISSQTMYTKHDDDETGNDWDPEDEEGRAIIVYPPVPGNPNLVKFDDIFVEKKRVESAVAYYGSRKGNLNNGHRNRPNLATMKSRFSFISNIHRLDKIRDFEKNELKYSRKQTLKFVAYEFEKRVATLIDQGAILHDQTLRFLIKDIMKANNIELKFDA
uniref:Uncharacterized protein n=1 Tax=Caenorhabditis japonica TaxID=281687 RepID=A0A8R1E5F1_CAEJA